MTVLVYAGGMIFFPPRPGLVCPNFPGISTVGQSILLVAPSTLQGGFSVDKKNQQSKSQFGTLTATKDANQDYTSSSKGGMAGGSMGASSIASGAGTLTAQYDANNDYGGQGNKQGSQTGQQKVKTSDKNIK
jgi:hypothetical protein